MKFKALLGLGVLASLFSLNNARAEERSRAPSSIENTINHDAENNENSAYTKDFQNKINDQQQQENANSAAARAHHDKVMDRYFRRTM
jgi:hypothetical protein